MKERPILMSAPMVRAILAGTKTQTRRVVKPCPAGDLVVYDPAIGWRFRGGPNLHCPYGQPGESRLWVRESFCTDGVYVGYKADQNAHDKDALWRPSIHMPRWASRITLELTAVRVQRVQEISEEDALAEGAPEHSIDTHTAMYRTARSDFEVLWDSINGKRPGCAWADSPWVWALTFRRVQA